MMIIFDKYLNDHTYHVLISCAVFVIALITIFILHRLVVNRLKKKAARSESKLDDFVIDLLKIPLLWLAIWILLKVFSSYSFVSDFPFSDSFGQINNILLIATIGWISIKGIKIAFYYFQNKQDVSVADNLNARKNLTKMKIFEGILVTIISVIVVAICLMTFDKVRSIGISLLTSAGIAGIIIGFAAQKSIATVLAGIQIAITQPIRLDDVVIVEGEWGRIEEITLTYVVVKIWDERRLVLPVSYFLEKPFQNWTRSTSNILGTVFLYVDYGLPVDVLRDYLGKILKDNPLWDKRVANIQVTDTNKQYKELRVLLSGKDSSVNWDLRVDIREKLIDFINKEYPGSFVKYRLSEDVK
ncbi:MAG: mechanosensitive ion channel [Dysgonomonas sp.]|nr:mechanosensitive ion channel [Dysgonomonas sp.]